MLAKLGREPFDSEQHLFEVKWDGFRAVSFCDGGAWRLFSRNRTDFVPRYPELSFLGRLPHGLVLDGEIVVFRDARPDFAAMLTREQARTASKIDYLSRTLPCTYVVFDVLYRREGETEWRPLKSALADTLVVWDTSSAPNGTYVLKVVASDTRSNPSESTLRGELESESFEIDNTPPAVTLGEIRRERDDFVVPLEVRDADSVLTRVEYSLDAQRWQTAFPVDGILDARHEAFEIRLGKSAAGQTLVVRANDSLNNVGSGQVQVREGGR